MRKPDFARVREVFVEVVDQPQADRHAQLRLACADDSALFDEVDELLRLQDTRDCPDALRRALGDLRPLPARLGKFDVLDELGEGGMGVVYLARNPDNGQEVAIKVLPPGPSPGQLEAFDQEAKLLARCRHPGIAQTLDFVPENLEGPLLVMERVDGVHLSTHCATLGAGAAGVSERLRLLADTCTAVDHAHQRGIIHQDLKPSNVMVQGDQVKVLDFGIAGQRGALRHAGTRPYMSPERKATPPGDIDLRCDVYSLGVLAHEVLAGSLPGSDQDTALGPQAGTHPGDLERVVARARAPAPADRYPSAAALGADLRRCAARRPLGEHPTAWHRLVHWRGRHPRLAVAAVLATAAALLGSLQLGRLEAESARQERQLEAKNAYDLGVFHATAGRWDEALLAYERAGQIGGLSPTMLSLARIDAWQGQGEVQKAHAALDELASRRDPDTDAFRAQILLLRADHTGDPRAKLQPVDTDGLEAALAAGGLSKADEHYARALLSATAEEALIELRLSLSDDSRHRRSLQMLPALLMASGEPAKAIAEARLLLQLFPNDPTAQVLLAGGLMLTGEPIGSTSFAEVAPGAYAETQQAFQTFTKMVGFQRNANHLFQVTTMHKNLGLPPPSNHLNQMLLDAVTLLPSISEIAGNGQLEALFRLPPAVVQQWTQLTSLALVAMTRIADLDAQQRLYNHASGMWDGNGDAVIPYLAGTAAALTGRTGYAAELFFIASQGESIFGVRRSALTMVIHWSATSSKPKDVERAIECMLIMARFDDLEPLELRFLASRALALDQDSLHRELVYRWSREHPDDPAAAEARAALAQRDRP